MNRTILCSRFIMSSEPYITHKKRNKSFTETDDNQAARGERVNTIPFSGVVLIAVATRIYGFVLSRYASMPWQSILYGTFCVSRICHWRHIARFGYRDIVTLFEKNRNVRNTIQFQTFVTRSVLSF